MFLVVVVNILVQCLQVLSRTISTDNHCLHKGCELTKGLHANKLLEILKIHFGEEFGSQNYLLIMQWNVLYDKKDIGADNWKYRKADVCDYINRIQPDIIGFQEVMRNQLKDLQICLPDYLVYGEPRENDHNPLYNPIFIRNLKRFDVTEFGTFWLSLTPEIFSSRLPSSKEPRICTWVKVNVTSHEQPKEVIVATTHLAWRSMKTADKQINVLLSYLKRNIMRDQQMPVILTGDFNWESNSSVYKSIDMSGIKNTMATADMAYPALTALPPYPGIVDYIWQKGFDSLISATLMDSRPNGRMLSDHRPVISVLAPNILSSVVSYLNKNYH